MYKLFFIAMMVTMTSCATVLGGQKTDHQANKPECGEPRRQIRVGFVIANLLLFPPGLILDFATEKIYKPQPRENRVKKCKDK